MKRQWIFFRIDFPWMLTLWEIRLSTIRQLTDEFRPNTCFCLLFSFPSTIFLSYCNVAFWFRYFVWLCPFLLPSFSPTFSLIHLASSLSTLSHCSPCAPMLHSRVGFPVSLSQSVSLSSVVLASSFTFGFRCFQFTEIVSLNRNRKEAKITKSKERKKGRKKGRKKKRKK